MVGEGVVECCWIILSISLSPVGSDDIGLFRKNSCGAKIGRCGGTCAD